MEVKDGYKRSQLGLIPDHWKVVPLKGMIEISHGFAFSSQYFTNSGQYRLTTPGHFYEAGGFRDIGDKQKYYDGPVPDNYILKGGDVIVAMTEQADGLLGSAAVIPDDHSYLHNQRLGRLRALCDGIDLSYLFFVFNSPSYRSSVRTTAVGTKVKHTSPEKLLEVLVRLPPLPEQKAIANALRDVDALIASLDALIAKKRDLKQAAMQQLLTGKARLQGFSGEWETKRLGELSQLYQPKTIGQSVFTTDGYPVYGANGIIGRYSKYNHMTRQITISCRGNCGTVNKTEQLAWITGNAMVVNFDANKSIDSDFAYQLLLFQDFSVLVTGSGQPQIVRGPLSEFLITLPRDINEQKAIAEVLSDMDAGLTELEQRRDKTIALKQGMMQELLTGRTRLV